MDIFVSRPNALSDAQIMVVNKLERLLKSRDMSPRTIGSTVFPNDLPMDAVEQTMRQCSGAIILGFPQIRINDGILKPDTSREEPIMNKSLPTPWNQIEAAMAFTLKLPLMIIRHRGIDGGIFDNGTAGRFTHTFDLNQLDWIDRDIFLQPFNEWYKQVLKSQQ